jgi:hypothetical protein
VQECDWVAPLNANISDYEATFFRFGFIPLICYEGLFSKRIEASFFEANRSGRRSSASDPGSKRTEMLCNGIIFYPIENGWITKSLKGWNPKIILN